MPVVYTDRQLVAATQETRVNYKIASHRRVVWPTGERAQLSYTGGAPAKIDMKMKENY